MFGVPQPLVEFFSVHDNFRIQTGTRVSIQHDALNTHWRLVIKNTTKNDFYEYRAEARNVAGSVNCVANLEEIKKVKIEPPKILDGLKNIKVKEGNIVEMSVKVVTLPSKDQPEPEIEWLKDGVPIKPDNRMCLEIVKADGFDEYKLVIQNAMFNDSGEISVKVKNPSGIDTSDAKLVIEFEELKLPEFTQPLKDFSIYEAENANFSVTACGNPEPKVEWLKNDSSINVDSQHIIISKTIQKITTSTLTITDAVLSDAGIYACKAFNKVGTVETKSNFSVEELTEAPKFVNDLHPIKINETESALFSVEVTGKPEPKVEWLRNGQVIEINNDHFITKQEPNGLYTLLVKEAKLEDAGSISCKAMNKVGQAETKANFAVEESIEKPQFIKGLNSLEIKELETAIFSVTVFGKPKPTLHWYKDDRPIQIDEEHFILKEEAKNDYILTVKNARLEDAGVISCQAINKSGIADSKANFGIQELTEAPKFITELEPIERKENQESVFLVVVSGKPQPDVTWYKDESPVAIDNSHIISKCDSVGHHTLIIKDTLLEDAGKYTCKAFNRAGQVETTANLGILEDTQAPHFTHGLKPIKVKETETATMSITVTGKPEPNIEWFKDGQAIQINDENFIVKKESVGSYLLIIKKSKLENAGIYSCKAVNKAGRDETTANFAVIEDLKPPHFTEKLKELEVCEGAQVAFECVVTGKPEPQIQWFKDEKLIQIDNNHIIYKKNDNGQQTLYINNARLSDAGTYSCKAVNKAGSDKTLADLSFPRIVEEKIAEEEVKPTFIIPLEAKTVHESEEVSLQCKVNSNESHPDIKWYRNDIPLDLNFEKNITAFHLSDGTITLKILNVTKNEIGLYKCEAINRVGKAETKANLNYAQQEELDNKEYERPLLSFIRHLCDKQITLNESIILECQLELSCVTNTIKIDWFKDGVHLTDIKLEQLNGDVCNLENGIQQIYIKNSKFEHIGIFRCEATDTINGNSVWTEGRLQVLGKWERQNFFFINFF